MPNVSSLIGVTLRALELLGWMEIALKADACALATFIEIVIECAY